MDKINICSGSSATPSTNILGAFCGATFPTVLAKKRKLTLRRKVRENYEALLP